MADEKPPSKRIQPKLVSRKKKTVFVFADDDSSPAKGKGVPPAAKAPEAPLAEEAASPVEPIAPEAPDRVEPSPPGEAEAVQGSDPAAESKEFPASEPEGPPSPADLPFYDQSSLGREYRLVEDGP